MFLYIPLLKSLTIENESNTCTFNNGIPNI